MYKARAGSVKEMAEMHKVSINAIYDTLDRFNVPRHNQQAAKAISESRKALLSERKSLLTANATGQIEVTPQVEYVPEVQEQPAPAIVPRTKRRPRRRKPWWRRLIDRLFKR